MSNCTPELEPATRLQADAQPSRDGGAAAIRPVQVACVVKVRLDPETREALAHFAQTSGARTVSEAVRHAVRLGARLVADDRAGGFRSGVVEGRLRAAAIIRTRLTSALVAAFAEDVMANADEAESCGLASNDEVRDP